MAKEKSQRQKWVAVIAVSLAATTSFAAGLGELTVVSRLGEPLTAYVTVQATPEELRSLTVQLAEPSVYREAGITPSPLVNQIQTRLIRYGSGWAVELKSREPVRDPFAHLLLDLRWNGGRIIREYALLIDPPNYALPAAPVAPTREVGASAAAPTEKVRTTSARSESAANQAPATGERTVVRGETLTAIARQIAPDAVPLEVVLYALWRDNPHAFVGNDPNRLLAGSRLRLPDPADLAAISPDQARQALQAYTGSFARRAARMTQQAAPMTQGETVQGQVAARSDRVPTALPSGDQVQISPTRVVSPESLATSRNKGAAAGVVPTEDLLALKGDLKEAQERIAALESALAKINQLLMAQAQLVDSRQMGEAAAPLAEAPPAPAAAPSLPPVAPAPTAAPAESTAGQTSSSVPPEVLPPPAAQPKEEVVAPSKREEQKAEPPKPQPQPPVAASEPSVLDFLLEQPLLLAGAAGALLLGAGAIWWRRRQQGEESEASHPESSKSASTVTQTIATTATTETQGNQTTEPAPSRLSAATGQEVDTSASILGSDFTQVAFNALQADEGIDPVTEAEVLLAYDRDQQAEEILLDALKQTPERPQIPLKLLEIYGKRGDRDRFEHYFGMVAALTGRTGKEWSSAIALHERFLGPLPEAMRAVEAPDASATAEETILSFEDVALDLDLPSRQQPASAPEPGKGQATEKPAIEALATSPAVEPTSDEPLPFAWASASVLDQSESLSLSGKEPTQEPTLAAAETVAAAEPNAPLLEFGEAELLSPKPIPEPPPTSRANTQEQAPAAEEVLLPDLDLDLDLGRDQVTEQGGGGASTPEPSLPPLPEVDELSLAQEERTERTKSAVLSESPSTSERVEISELPTLDLATVMEEPEVAASEEELDGRLQLAKAYLEMEDYEGARELLEEVIRDATPEAKARAEALLAQLPG